MRSLNGKVLISGENGSYRIDYSGVLQAPENVSIRLKPLVGAGRFGRPTPGAQGGFPFAPGMPCFRLPEVQARAGIGLSPVAPGGPGSVAGLVYDNLPVV